MLREFCPLSFSTFSQLTEWAQNSSSAQHISDTDVVSFDVFDTLLYRRCSGESVQRGVAAQLALAIGLPESAVDEVCHERERAFHDCATINRLRGLDADAHLDNINLAWVKRLVPLEPERWTELSAIARTMKIQYEKWASFPNPAITPLLANLHDRGKRLIFVSDMYLGVEIIFDLLTTSNLRHFFSAGYVSGDVALNKHSGRLFQYVTKKEGVDARRMMHIGDNRHADGHRAVEQGIRAIVVQERETPLKRMRYDHNYALQDRRWLGYNAAKFASAASVRQTEPEFHALGRDVLGPPFAAFIHGLAEYCMRIRPDAVYFLSREGFLLKELYDQLIETLGLPVPRGGYLCSSRLASTIPAMRGFGWREVTLKMAAHRTPTIRKIMALLKFPPDELEKLAHSCGVYNLDKAVNAIDSPSFSKLVAHPAVQNRAKDLGREARKTLREYLEKQHFFDAHKVVLVDVGWAGQIQEGLELALSSGSSPVIYGYYLGLNSNGVERRAGGTKLKADLADITKYEWTGCSVFSFVEFFENASRALHGTVVGYRNGEPVLLPEDSIERLPELPDEPRIALLQDGIRNYMLHYSRYAAMMGIKASESFTYSRNIVARVIRFPRRNELMFFSPLAHMANFGSSEQILFVPKPSFFSSQGFLAQINTSHWRQGSTALRFGRYGALLLSFFQAPRISRECPPQTKDNLMDYESHEDSWNPFTPPPHDFEAEVNARLPVLLNKGRTESLSRIHQSPLSLYELWCLHLCYRASNVYLALKKLNRFHADLLPMKSWLWREIYIRIPLHGRIGRSLRLIKRWITAIVSF